MVINDVDVGNGLMDFACVSDLEDYIAELRERTKLDILEARIEEAKLWHSKYGGHEMAWCCAHIDRLQVRLDALAKEGGKT